MNSLHFFIGRMSEPALAHVLHLSVLDFQVTRFLREQIAKNKAAVGDGVVLIADPHLNAKPTVLRLLRKSIEVAGFRIVGVLGDDRQMWAQHLEAPALEGKPRMTPDAQALELRKRILTEASEQLEELNIVQGIVGSAIDRVDQMSELHEQRRTLLSFEERQQQAQQNRPAVIAEPIALVEPKTAAALRSALEQQKMVGVDSAPTENESGSPAPEIPASVTQAPQEEMEPVEISADSPSVLDEQLTHLINSSVQAPSLTNETADVPMNHRIEAEFDVPQVDANLLENNSNLAPVNETITEETAPLCQSTETWDDSAVLKASLAIETPCRSSVDTGPTPPPAAAPVRDYAMNVPLRVEKRIRSGVQLWHDGDVIVEESVHSSAEIVARGDIHVYGTGGGKLFAGVNGNQNACIYIHVFDAEIVSIAGHYHVIEDDANNWVGRSIKISLEDGVLHFKEICLLGGRRAA